MPHSTTPASAVSAINSREWLADLLREKCGILSPREFQLCHGLDLINGKDLFLVIAPGQGKTTVLHAPLLAAQARGESGIAFLVVPTKLLALQHADVATKRGLRALAINEDTVRAAYHRHRDLFAELSCGADVRIAVMSPKMLQSERMQKLLARPDFKRTVRWFLIDEAHLVDEDSGEWLQVYNSIKTMRTRLLSSTIWAGVTGTATPSRALVIARGLGFQPGCYINARYSVDNPNIKYIPRFLEHSISGKEFWDLSFLIPFDISCPGDIPSTVIFCETVELGNRLMTFLDTLLPSTLPSRHKIIKMYNAIMPPEYRSQLVDDLTMGSVVRIVVCTDTCTYGFDVSIIARAVTVGICATFEMMKQRMCRAGRDGAPAVAYTFAPTWVRDVASGAINKHTQDAAARRAKLPPVILQWFNATVLRCPRHVDFAYNEDPFTLPSTPCCSLHHPEPEESEDLTAITRWRACYTSAPSVSKPPAPRSDGTHRALDAQMKASLTHMLERWRTRRWYAARSVNIDHPANVFFPSLMITRLVDKAHVCTSLQRLSEVLGPWKHFEGHGTDLLEYLQPILEGFDEIYAARKPIILSDDKTDADGNQRALRHLKLDSGDLLPVTVAPTGVKVEYAEDNTVQETSRKPRRVRLIIGAAPRPAFSLFCFDFDPLQLVGYLFTQTTCYAHHA